MEDVEKSESVSSDLHAAIKEEVVNEDTQHEDIMKQVFSSLIIVMLDVDLIR